VLIRGSRLERAVPSLAPLGKLNERKALDGEKAITQAGL